MLDFFNDTDQVQKSFEDYYRTTVLSDETDPDKLHDLQAELDAAGIYTWESVEKFVALYLDGVDRDRLDLILDVCQAAYVELNDFDEDGVIAFKANAKTFVRTYAFLSAILPYTNANWEKLSIFLTFLIPKLPSPKEDDLSAGILESIDMESYRVEKRKAMKIALADEEAEFQPIPTSAGGHRTDPELERLSDILRTFNDLFGNIEWEDGDRIRKLITEEIPDRVAADKAYQNAQANNDRRSARIEHDRADQGRRRDLPPVQRQRGFQALAV